MHYEVLRRLQKVPAFPCDSTKRRPWNALSSEQMPLANGMSTAPVYTAIFNMDKDEGEAS